VIPASTLPGVYTVEYTICDISIPTNCATSVAVVIVSAAPIVPPTPVYPIVASPDSVTYPYGSGGILPILPNDTYSGMTASTGTVIATLQGNGGISGVTLSGGSLVVPASTPSGVYVVPYQICEL
jgi:hypothetical protein